MDQVMSAYSIPGMSRNIGEDKDAVLAMAIKVTCSRNKVTPEQLFSKNRQAVVVYVRQQIYYYMKQRYLDKAQSVWLGKQLRQDHSTVLNSLQEYQNRMDTKGMVPIWNSEQKSRWGWATKPGPLCVIDDYQQFQKEVTQCSLVSMAI